MATTKWGEATEGSSRSFRAAACVPAVLSEHHGRGRDRHHDLNTTRNQRVLTVASRIGAVVAVFFGLQQFALVHDALWIGILNVASGLVFLAIPRLYRFGELVAPLVFIVVAYAVMAVVGSYVGSGIGLHFYYLAAAAIILLILGIEHLLIASVLATVGAFIVVALEVWVPHNTGAQPDWAFRLGFVINTAAAWILVVATLWFSLRETARAERAMEVEYQRSEALLANILPAPIAQRLKDPARSIIADGYDDASILFADIAGYTKRASITPPDELVRFLDVLYTNLDGLVDKHGLEKVKTSGDSYMVVSGVPRPRGDHLEALARFALDMTEAVAGLTDPDGREVPLRIGVASGPVVAGVVGARKFFYDVWGDAVNVASRMESTDEEGRIQVPQDVYERLRDEFTFEERGQIDVKGKGLMHTWYLTGRKTQT